MPTLIYTAKLNDLAWLKEILARIADYKITNWQEYRPRLLFRGWPVSVERQKLEYKFIPFRKPTN